MLQLAARIVAEHADHIAERQQAQVDVDALLETQALGLGLALSLRARQVDQVELGAGHGRLHVGPLLERDCEDGVRARRGVVHGRAAHHTLRGALLQPPDCLHGIVDVDFEQIDNTDCVVLLAHVQRLGVGFQVEEVLDLLVVNFYKANSHLSK